MAVAYDLVLEDHILARQATKRGNGRSRRELAEMVRFAVGYRSRAFVTFGRAIPVDGIRSIRRDARFSTSRITCVRKSAISSRCCPRR